MKMLIAAALGLTLLVPPGLAKERTGSFVTIAKRDNTGVQGELLAVRGTELILRDASAGQGITIDLREISAITWRKKGGFGRGAGKGFLIAGLGGFALGFALDNDRASLHGAELATVVGLPFAAIGAVVGGLVGATSRREKTLFVESTEAAYLAGIAAKLRPLSRDRT